MASKALIILVGHVGGEPELNVTTNGTSVLKFSLAVNTGFKERSKVTWYKCSFFGKRADSVAPYVSKGKNIMVSGEPELNEWTNDEGKKFTNIQVNVNDLTLLSSGQQQEQSGNRSPDPDAGLEQLGDDSDIPY